MRSVEAKLEGRIQGVEGLWQEARAGIYTANKAILLFAGGGVLLDLLR